MNCREAQQQIFSERDVAPGSTRRDSLAEHVSHCAGCRELQATLTTALDHWRLDSHRTTVPDAQREWHAVRRKIRGAESGTERAPRRFLPWLTVSLGVMAAVATALVVITQTPSQRTNVVAATRVARADSVEVPGNNASTMVFVDEKSGWLFVWASDARPKSG
jgi:hypothetical protein